MGRIILPCAICSSASARGPGNAVDANTAPAVLMKSRLITWTTPFEITRLAMRKKHHQSPWEIYQREAIKERGNADSREDATCSFLVGSDGEKWTRPRG